ncbi:SPFH domain-containing protein [Atopobium sp. oral taxon 810]|uniref:SPFH domain-containing protein n=1 Tax=Atopobium sp. oral taxon 810 TaxID=712158 RepID=UPI00041CC0CB|nr:SPFH domain-containing protein [Atopobium sp. oral taxon 810]
MGLIKAAVGAAGGVLADSWKEMIYCDSLPENVLAVKGQKRTSGRSSNVRGEENIITNGSRIIVNDGQAMIIVDQGAVVDFCGDPGEYTYDQSSEPSFFSGDLGENITKMFEQIGGRFAFGGDTGHDQRVYYFNTKEIIGNKYGTATPVPFRVVDNNIGLDVDISVRCNGLYSYKITNPLLFYKSVCGNVEQPYTRDRLDAQLKSELLTALQPAFAKISGMGIRYSAVPAHTLELAEALNEQLSSKWRDLRGIEIAEFGVNSISASPEDEQMIKDLQKSATMRDPGMRAAALAGAQADAMRAAASNTAGAMTGFLGMNMAGMAGMGAQQTYAQAPSQTPTNQYQTAASGGFAAPAPASAPVATSAPTPAAAPAGSWTCSNCGATNTGKFCAECGTPKPAASNQWTCSNCGATNTGKFCSECGNPRA